jgi:sporulation protein YlmC with PRC-barrel domain
MKDHSNNIVRTEDVIGKEVYSDSHDKLGNIEEIVLDKVSGQARYIVLSFDTFMGFGGKYFAFPWKSISYDKDKEAFILNVAKDKLEDGRGFDKDHWPDMAQEEWQKETENYYESEMML